MAHVLKNVALHRLADLFDLFCPQAFKNPQWFLSLVLAKLSKDCNAEKILKKKQEDWTAAVARLAEMDVAMGPKFQSSLVTVACKAAASFRDMMMIAKPDASGKAFDPLRPCLGDTVLDEVSKAQLVVRCLIDGVAVPLIAKGPDGRSEMEFFVKELRQMCVAEAERESFLQEAVSELADVANTLGLLLGVQSGAKPDEEDASMSSVMSSNGSHGRGLVGQALRQTPYYKSLETNFRKARVANQTMVPDMNERMGALAAGWSRPTLEQVCDRLPVWLDALLPEQTKNMEEKVKEMVKKRFDECSARMQDKKLEEPQVVELLAVVAKFKNVTAIKSDLYNYFVGYHQQVSSLADKLSQQKVQQEAYAHLEAFAQARCGSY
eukprot:5550112-Amphidinium_carterae.1